jgi:hypothetical protein
LITSQLSTVADGGFCSPNRERGRIPKPLKVSLK